MARDLVIGQALARIPDQLFCTYERSGLKHHTGSYQFTPLRIRYSENRDLTDCRVVQNYRFDLAGVNILAARNDHVLQSVQYIEVAVYILKAEISGAKKTV